MYASLDYKLVDAVNVLREINFIVNILAASCAGKKVITMIIYESTSYTSPVEIITRQVYSMFQV